MLCPTSRWRPTASRSSSSRAPPGGLVATAASSSSIDLVWNDNSDNELSFKIQRSPDTNPLTYEVVDTDNAEATSYSDLGLDPFTTCWYRIVAFNNDGDSAPSNEDSATTLKAGDANDLLLASFNTETCASL